MKLQNRNGVLGLETTKQVMVTFLVLSVTAIAILLSLTALDDSIGNTIDISYSPAVIVANETGAYINVTGYTLSGYNSTWSSITATAVWNETTAVLLGSGNYTLSSVGVLTNASTSDYSTNNYGVNVSYTYLITIDSESVNSIIGNVSSGLVVFFASTGTIFSILIVVVIILAISIIIWAVGRFGQQTEGTVNL
ncbi:hypothetical protein LCGC14_1509880 [marine sediment metagenome]|uniref:Uncharacterized protein n=1 Tax=marine sediment metagenome TaxID=412755 RepID=A0A0F9JMF4_9ZZZZ